MRLRTISHVFATALIWTAMSGVVVSLPAYGKDRSEAGKSLSEEVRHQLVMLPYYSVFDDLAYSVNPDNTVVLMGRVIRPSLKSDAEHAVRRVAGVERVINNIEVLPPSPGDDRIRIAVYRAIYGNDQLFRYGIQAVPPIHIIVKNGRVDLTGTVSTEVDKAVAGIAANSVPGTFSVANDLTVESGH